jgi:hypothetical protein
MTIRPICARSERRTPPGAKSRGGTRSFQNAATLIVPGDRQMAASGHQFGRLSSLLPPGSMIHHPTTGAESNRAVSPSHEHFAPDHLACALPLPQWRSAPATARDRSVSIAGRHVAKALPGVGQNRSDWSMVHMHSSSVIVIGSSATSSTASAALSTPSSTFWCVHNCPVSRDR